MSIKNPYEHYPMVMTFENGKFYGFNEGVKAAVQYLEEPCTEHIHLATAATPYALEYQHRYDCPDCMKQVREEIAKIMSRAPGKDKSDELI